MQGGDGRAELETGGWRQARIKTYNIHMGNTGFVSARLLEVRGQRDLGEGRIKRRSAYA